MASTNPDLRCSFCEKSADEVEDMIAMSMRPKEVARNAYAVSHKVAICDECVALCVEVLAEKKQPQSAD